MPTVTQQIRHRWTKAVLFECEVDASLSPAKRLGVAVEQAVKAGANLRGANLSGANLSVSNLTRANLTGAIFSQANFAGASLIAKRILDGGLRSDGWRFFLWWDSQRGWRIRAGCRDFTPAVAREHWTATRGGTTLGAESLAILDHLERMAAIRGWDLSEQPKGENDGPKT